MLRAGHPKGLVSLFFAEMWERFSFYGMRSLLVLYMTKQMFYGDKVAYGVYGAYGALVYASPVIGGMFADKLLGHQKAVMLGAVLMALGHFCMAVPNEIAFYMALALLVLGNGFFKPNISSIVGKLYPVGDPRRDAGFTIFYMGINLGAFFSPLVCGVIGELYGWHYGFGIAGIGMLIGLLVFRNGRHHFAEHGLPPDPAKLKAPLFVGLSRQTLLYIGCAMAVPFVALLLNRNQFTGSILYIVATGILGYLIYQMVRCEKVERDRLIVILVLTFFSTLFWAFFEQAGSSLTLFADRNVDRTFFGWTMPASLTQSLNPLFIVVLAPLFAKMWVKMQGMSKHPSIPTKFVWALAQVGLGFGILVFGSIFAKDTGITAMVWLVLAYLLHTTGELCLSPVGLSAVTKLSPARLVATVFGAWFLSSSFAHYLGGAIAKFTEVATEEGMAAVVDPVASLPVYTGVFTDIFWVSLAATALLFLCVPFLKKMTHGVE